MTREEFRAEHLAEGYTDIGHDHFVKFCGWHPDRQLNPQYDSIPDIERCGLIVAHLKPGGEVCECGGFIHFDTPEVRRVFPGGHWWQVSTWDPLTVSPSLLCNPAGGGCGDHGFIREGRWIVA